MTLALRRAVWVLTGIAVTALATSGEIGAARAAGFPALWAALFAIDEKGRLLKGARLQTILVLGFLFLGLARWVGQREPFLMVVADFLVAFLFTKGAFVKTVKDLQQMTALSFFILLAAASLSLNIGFLAAFVAYTLCATVVLTLFTLEGLAHQGDTPGPRRLAPVLARTAAISLFCASSLAFLMFVFFPRWSAAVFQGRFLGPLARSGFSDTIRLEGAGDIYRDPRIVLRVETGSPWDGYLRGSVLNRFDGARWTAAPLERTTLRGFRLIENRFVIPGGGTGPSGALRRQRIYLEPVDSPTLFASPWPAVIEAMLPRLLVAPDGTVRRSPEHKGRLAYTAYSHPRPVSLDSPTPEDTLLPPNWPGTERTRELLEKWRPRRATPIGTAQAILARLKIDYGYSLEDEAGRAPQPVESFLFDVKRGHCELFATALAVMLRLDNIPARLVTGFRAHERNLDGGHYVVRAQDAHAWVEAWIDGRWVLLDPTPSARFAPPAQSALRRWKERWEYLNFLWNARVLSYDLETQKDIAVSAFQTSQRWDRKFQTLRDNWRERLKGRWAPSLSIRVGGGKGWWAVPMVFVVGGLLWVLIRRKKSARADTGVWFYRQALDVLSRRGFARAPAETPWEYQRRLSDRPEIGAPLQSITDLFCETRYGQRPLSADGTHQARTALAALRRPSRRP
ncbi:MAG: DUF3488 domain-containing protein [Elusimicrobia bacterium]|nr:DUF3488 domain-containing protein [Elusimicrobiota bacterium]